MIRHSGYDPHNPIKHDKDIALMELDRNVELTSNIGTVCVPDSPEIEYYDDCFLTGESFRILSIHFSTSLFSFSKNSLIIFISLKNK